MLDAISREWARLHARALRGRKWLSITTVRRTVHQSTMAYRDRSIASVRDARGKVRIEVWDMTVEEPIDLIEEDRRRLRVYRLSPRRPAVVKPNLVPVLRKHIDRTATPRARVLVEKAGLGASLKVVRAGAALEPRRVRLNLLTDPPDVVFGEGHQARMTKPCISQAFRITLSVIHTQPGKNVPSGRWQPPQLSPHELTTRYSRIPSERRQRPLSLCACPFEPPPRSRSSTMMSCPPGVFWSSS